MNASRGRIDTSLYISYTLGHKRRSDSMMPNIQMALNQQFQQGCSFAQQAMMSEQMGNLPAAAQCYDQAVQMIGNSMVTRE
jgi:hypothetical protein